MRCPVCDKHVSSVAEVCSVCLTDLRYLRQNPRRVAYCVVASIVLGTGLFVALAWQVFTPLLSGRPPAAPNPGFWLAFAVATFFLCLGLSARQQLAEALRRLVRSPRR